MTETLAAFASKWQDTPESNATIQLAFWNAVNADPVLKAHRDYIEAGDWGKGCRSFHWMWKILVDAMPRSFNFLEIGIHRGQVPSVIGLLAHRVNKECEFVGVSPYDGRDMTKPRDYLPDVLHLLEKFAQEDIGDDKFFSFYPIKGDSTQPEIVSAAARYGFFDMVYIDGNHSYSSARADIQNYGEMVRSGGYLLVDDAGCFLNQPEHFWKGIDEVSKATDELLPPKTPNSQWEHLGNLIHLRIWRRK